MENQEIVTTLKELYHIDAAEASNNQIEFRTDVRGQFGFTNDVMFELGGYPVLFEIDFDTSVFGTTTKVTVLKDLHFIPAEKLVEYFRSDFLDPLNDLSQELQQRYLTQLAKSDEQFSSHHWWIFDQILGNISHSRSEGVWEPNEMPQDYSLGHLRFVRDAIKVGTYPWDYYKSEED